MDLMRNVAERGGQEDTGPDTGPDRDGGDGWWGVGGDRFVTSSNINTKTLGLTINILTQNNFSLSHFSLLSLDTVPEVIS